MEEQKWYVIHTYSGYENKVKANLERIIEHRKLTNLISSIEVPMHAVTELKDGRKKTVARRIFPGYVLIKMLMNDYTWSIVRNARGVTSFVGPGSKPCPLTEAEMKVMGIKKSEEKVGLNVADSVRIISGPFENSVGIVDEVNIQKRSVIVKLSIFGRETPVELDFFQVQKI
jgi:transcriptional antiterminator NusG